MTPRLNEICATGNWAKDPATRKDWLKPEKPRLDTQAARYQRGFVDVSTYVALEKRFMELVSEWRNEAGRLALAHKRVFHRSYQQIIGMGRDALPLILRELRDNEEDWFWALMMITGENLFREGQTYEEARQAWISWGESKNLI